ncbi:MAG TPA: TIGR02281 family clan AA aspartic protease [Usitatibacter sp.]|nr:TIGR02281 family clan AA aspartic protease [Usitatibacter sp.]
MRHRAFALLACLVPVAAPALDVNVIGLFPGKAVIVVDRGAPRTLSAGQSTPEGVKLISTDARSALLEIDGKTVSVEMGQHFETPAQTGSRSSVTLSADSRGHYVTDGAVNGVHVRFLVDTGATLVAIPAADATRLGVDYRKGRRAFSQTANGTVPFWLVRLDSVTVGGVTLTNVDGAVHEGPGLDVALLGMSFLGRMEMRREGPHLTLTKRY